MNLRKIFRTMSKDNFQLAYDGPAVRDGSMDVYELAPALLSIGDLIRDANRFLNQDRAEVSVQVQSDFQHGSFEISYVIDQNLLAHAKDMLFAGSLSEAKEILVLLFGTNVVSGGLVIGAIKLYKMLKGKKPEPSSIKIDNSTTTIINNIQVDSRTANLYMNDGIRGQLDRVVSPVTKAGFDKMEVRKDKAVLEEVNKTDLPERLLGSGEKGSGENALVNSREAFLSVETANFAKGKWRVSDGSAKFNAELNDPAFRQHIDNREEGFFSGDTLRVTLTTTQTVKADGKIQTAHSIDKVIEHKHGATQERLLPPPSKKE